MADDLEKTEELEQDELISMIGDDDPVEEYIAGEEPDSTEEVTDEEDETVEEPEQPSEQPHQFDKERQQDQIRAANAEKMAQQLVAQNAALAQQIQDFQDKKSDTEDSDEILDYEGTLKELKSQLKENQGYVAQLAQVISSEREAQKIAVNNAKTEKALRDLETTYGKQYTEKALEGARASLKSQGWSLDPNDPRTIPSASIASMAMENAFMKLEREARAASVPKKVKKTVRQDDGRAGHPAGRKPVRGTPEQVLAHMKAQGKFNVLARNGP